MSIIKRLKSKSGRIHLKSASTNSIPKVETVPIRPPLAVQLLPNSQPATNGATPKPKVSFADPSAVTTVANPLDLGITDLCSIIASCTSNLPEYGCLSGPARQYKIQPLCKAHNEPQKSITLEALLQKDRPIDLSRRQRYHIAMILASSHVQLHSTPWLKSKWSKKDIHFLYDDENPDTICVDQPYISRSLCRTLHQKTSGTSTVQSHAFQDSIRNLGIMLLELCFGTAIEDYKGRPNVGGTDEQMIQLINYAAAIQWSRDVVEEAGLEYSDAVTWCLHNVPDGTVTEGNEDKWREDMYGKVVEPLKYCHDQLVSV